MKKRKKEKKVIKKEDKMLLQWDVRKFISKIVSKEVDGFNYYFWTGLPKMVIVNEKNIAEGDVVYRAQELVGRVNVNTKSVYTFLGFTGEGNARIQLSKYNHERIVKIKELCKKIESTYATRKRIETLQLHGELFFSPDEQIQEKVDKSIKRKRR